MTPRHCGRDESAFRLFHERCFDRLHRIHLVAACGQEQAAQDALPETLLRVVRHAWRFYPETAFWNWLRAVARSMARDAGRERRWNLELLERFTSQAATQSEPPASNDDNALEAARKEALAELKPPDRRLFEGKPFDGATVCELAVPSGFTDQAIESHLLRLHQASRKRILQKLRGP